MLSQFGKAGLIKKAQSPPEKVRQVLAKVSTDGLLATAQAVRNKLDQPLPLGYSAVGTVTEVGEGVTGFSIGDRVVCNGNHAEAVVVPENLVAHVRADWRTKHAPVGLRSGIIKALGFQTEALFSPGPHLQTSRPHKHSQVESWLTLTN
jgi:threonine dehydrogenase-like Zn-dependent dehydrogenase